MESSIITYSSVQLLSHVRLFVNPWTAARLASLSITTSQSLPKLISVESVMPSNHFMLCHPLLLLPSTQCLYILYTYLFFSLSKFLNIKFYYQTLQDEDQRHQIIIKYIFLSFDYLKLLTTKTNTIVNHIFQNNSMLYMVGVLCLPGITLFSSILHSRVNMDMLSPHLLRDK